MNTQEAFLENTLKNLRQLIDDSNLREKERARVIEEIKDIESMLNKLENGIVEITAFGEINSGKSSLLNALIGREVFETSAEGGKTRAKSREEWVPVEKEFSGKGGTRLILVDTPGINEVAGAERTAIAQKTVRESDIVLFVTYGDLNDIEFKALDALHSLNKPLILVLNKCDLFTRKAQEETYQSIERKLAGMIGPDDIVWVAGAPGPRIRERNGIEEEYTPKPMLEGLQARILEILREEGKAVVALNANLFAADVSDRIAQLKVEVRQAEANALIEKFMWGKAIAVALNPAPGLDIVGGMGVDVAMLWQLGKIYGQTFTVQNAQSLLRTILTAWGITGSVEGVAHLLSMAIKTGTFGVGTVLTALPQGVVAGWSTYVIGNAASVYFREGGWGPKGPKQIIKEILAQSDRSSVLQPLKERLQARLRGTAYLQTESTA